MIHDLVIVAGGIAIALFLVVASRPRIEVIVSPALERSAIEFIKEHRRG